MVISHVPVFMMGYSFTIYFYVLFFITTYELVVQVLVGCFVFVMIYGWIVQILFMMYP